MWPLAVLFIGLIAVVLYWPSLYEFVANKFASVGRTGPERIDDRRVQAPATIDRFPAPAKSVATAERAPAAPMEKQSLTHTNIGSNNPAIASAPVTAASGKNLKSAVQAIAMDGVYIEQLRDENDSLTIIGYADDNKVIASYLRRLQQSVGNPLLNMAKREERQGKLVSRFSIKLRK